VTACDRSLMGQVEATRTIRTRAPGYMFAEAADARRARDVAAGEELLAFIRDAHARS